ncbi:MAG: zinc metalloprotease HtpX [candidate division Zixibacteria bacterium]|nr:zinc metalloprotease HtpX [candidate division Zixibacteria bacterium]MDH3937396.1 zinc metalloprotease HtpX [candidate division Zixibacteria bacterium]MDH4033396.1 zinc metalloprotease HtpX [candidate division Zixibacteria bacterium]
MNALKTTVMMLVLVAVFMQVGYYVRGPSGMAIAFVFACTINLCTYWYSDKIILRMYRARQITEADHPRLFRVVQRVATQAMIPMPKVCIVPSKAPNAFATGRNAEHAAVAVTEGLLGILTEDELEGVIGHEVAHIINKDMLIGTIAATFAGAIGILASIARWGAIFGGYSRGDSNRGGVFGLLIAGIVAPLVAVVLQTAISRQREYKADARGGTITRKPQALASALEKLHRSPTRMNLDQRPATANLMIINPLSGRGMSSWFSTHPPVEERIDRLHTLAEELPYQGYDGI